VNLGPTIITPLEVARAVGWTKEGDDDDKRKAAKRKAVRWLRAAGALVEQGGKRFTTREKLKLAFPDIYEEIQMARFDAEDEGP
jgi:hypothetical protein